MPSFNRSALSLFLLWDSLYLCISVEDRDYPRNGPVLEYHGYWRQGCNTRMATWGGNGVSRLQTRLGQLQKFYFNAKIASVAPAAAIMQPRDKKFGKSGAERLFAQSALLLMAKTFSQVEFLSDPGPIIVYSCHSLTDWLTNWRPCWRLNELT